MLSRSLLYGFPVCCLLFRGPSCWCAYSGLVGSFVASVDTAEPGAGSEPSGEVHWTPLVFEGDGFGQPLPVGTGLLCTTDPSRGEAVLCSPRPLFFLQGLD